MRRVAFVFTIGLISFGTGFGGPPAHALDLHKIITDETPAEQCDRLATDPFAGFGPAEWGRPFSRIDHFRALPACTKAHEAQPDEQRFELGIALATVAGKTPQSAKPLLEELIAKDNTSAMLILAYISPEDEAAGLMRRAADAGSANAMMLYGMSLMTGKGVTEDPVEGVRMMRRAAEAGSTRAMLILANYYDQGSHGLGFDPEEGTRLITAAVAAGDPAAKTILADRQAKAQAKAEAGGTTPQ